MMNVHERRERIERLTAQIADCWANMTQLALDAAKAAIEGPHLGDPSEALRAYEVSVMDADEFVDAQRRAYDERATLIEEQRRWEEEAMG